MKSNRTLKRLFSSLAIGVWLWTAQAVAQNVTPRLVRDYDGFRTHVDLHIKRVEAIGMALYDFFPEHFQGVDQDLLRSYLRLHDQSKINQSSSFLRRHGLAEEQPLLQRLFLYYAQDTGLLVLNPVEDISTTTSELNRVDHEVAMVFFGNLGLVNRDGSLKEVARKMQLIEKVADVVDRAQDPVAAQEFNREMKAAHLFLKDPLAKKLASFVELTPNLYHSLTKGLSFPGIAHSKPPSCRTAVVRSH